MRDIRRSCEIWDEAGVLDVLIEDLAGQVRCHQREYGLDYSIEIERSLDRFKRDLTALRSISVAMEGHDQMMDEGGAECV